MRFSWFKSWIGLLLHYWVRNRLLLLLWPSYFIGFARCIRWPISNRFYRFVIHFMIWICLLLSVIIWSERFVTIWWIRDNSLWSKWVDVRQRIIGSRRCSKTSGSEKFGWSSRLVDIFLFIFVLESLFIQIKSCCFYFCYLPSSILIIFVSKKIKRLFLVSKY